MRSCVIAILLIAGPSVAQDAPIKVPPSVAVREGKLGEVRAETAGKVVKWLVTNPALDHREADGGKTLIFTGPKGTYTLYAYTAIGDVPSDPVKCVVTIGEGGPNPPPVPPDPVPPAPNDPLRDRISVAFANDPAPLSERKKQALDLVALYRAAVETAKRPDVVTAEQLLVRLQEASAEMLGDPKPTVENPNPRKKLFDVRRVAAFEFGSIYPQNGAITDAQRLATVALLNRLASVIEDVAK